MKEEQKRKRDKADEKRDARIVKAEKANEERKRKITERAQKTADKFKAKNKKKL